jgi:hypothetical protein
MPVQGKGQFLEFLDWLRDYLPAEPSVHETGAAGQPGRKADARNWRENRFYDFDAEAVAGICHAIEVLALEEASGQLVSLVGDFSEFEAHRECYQQLAATIKKVEALGFGRAPRNSPHLQFRRDDRARHFRGVIYQGEKQPAMFLCRVGSARQARSQNTFRGFLSMDRGLTSRFADALRAEAMPQRRSASDDKLAREFTRLEALDQAAKELEKDLVQQRQTLHAAVRRLQIDARYQPGQFATELEKGISRLSEWKSRMPEILARAAR